MIYIILCNMKINKKIVYAIHPKHRNKTKLLFLSINHLNINNSQSISKRYEFQIIIKWVKINKYFLDA